jgi:hypothetical protein
MVYRNSCFTFGDFTIPELSSELLRMVGGGRWKRHYNLSSSPYLATHLSDLANHLLTQPPISLLATHLP